MDNNRQIIFDVLNHIFSDTSYSTIALDSALNNVENGTDKAFITRIVYGVIEKKITLEYIISKSLDRPYNKVKPKLRAILLMGAYQIYFCDKIPSRAAINECVDIAKSKGLDFYKGFINAVLRKCDENRIDIENLDYEIKYSVPKHLINMWTKQYGTDNTKNILSSLSQKAPLFVKANTLYVDNDELIYELNCEDVEAEIVDDAVSILSPINIKKSVAFKNGLFHIQDLSSQNCAKSLKAKENEIVIDVCSAPGGKSFTIAQGMNNLGKIYSFDLYEHRLNLINDGAKRLGITNITTMVNDATVFNETLPMADKVLCDVPCSGFGIIRRKPEIRYKDLDSIKDLPDIQYKILEVSSKYLKKSGRMIYSTCTLNKKENEKVVDKFILNHSDFKLLETKTVFPTVDGGDGFFFAIIERD